MRDVDFPNWLVRMFTAMLIFMGVMMLIDIRSALRSQASSLEALALSAAKAEARYAARDR